MGKLTKMFDKTITVYNKLSGADSATKQDVWYRHVLHDCSFTSDTVRNVSGNTVSVGNAFVCRVPENPDYLPYSEWKENPDIGFTLNVGDYVFLGEVDELITPNTLQKIYQQYKDRAFQVRGFKDNTGAGRLKHYRLDGV